MATDFYQQIISTAKKTLQIEATAVQGLQQYINADFVACVQHIYQTKGRVVLTGIGKSAIIAQKIVATFNSTGTPSLFMHAADAIHGDLGMIRAEDIVIVLSKSGETPEIKVLVPLVKNMGSLLIALVGQPQSYLARQAHFILNTFVEQEACPNQLAPTASTTAQLAMGDALAMSVLSLRQFTPQDFAKFHPGGALGKQLYLRVDDLYAQHELPFVFADTPIQEVIMEITSKRLGATAVLSPQKKLLGMITDGDLRRAFQQTPNLTNLTASHLMNTQPKTIEKQTLAIDALQLMRQHQITQVIVLEGEQYVGMVHIHDLVREGLV